MTKDKQKTTLNRQDERQKTIQQTKQKRHMRNKTKLLGRDVILQIKGNRQGKRQKT
jgi:hypothetical protein